MYPSFEDRPLQRMLVHVHDKVTDRGLATFYALSRVPADIMNEYHRNALLVAAGIAVPDVPYRFRYEEKRKTPDVPTVPVFISDDIAALIAPSGTFCEAHIRTGRKTYILNVPNEIIDQDCNGNALRRLLSHMALEWISYADGCMFYENHEGLMTMQDLLENVPEFLKKEYGIQVEPPREPMLWIDFDEQKDVVTSIL